MQTTRFTLLFSLLLGAGCGPAAVERVQTKHNNREPVVMEGDIPTQIEFPTMQAQIEAAKNGRLTCEFKDECEPALAMLSVATSKGLSRCTGFLISDHEVLTNDHCLEGVTDCRDLVFVHFSGDVNSSCKKITVRSHQKGINSKDYAVVELNDSIRDRSPLRLSRRGFQNREKATIFRVQTTRDTQKNTFDGIQTKLTCEANYPTLMNINIDSSKAPVMTFGDCAIQEGNSGSPILNEEGDVGAVNQGYLSVKDDDFSERIKPYLLDASYGQVAIGTQTRCMTEVVGRAGLFCDPILPISALYPEEYVARFGAFTKNSLPKIPYNTIWKEVAPEGQVNRSYVNVPECISRTDATSNHFRFASSLKKYRLGINSRLQTEWRDTNPDGDFVIFTLVKSESTSINAVFTSQLGKINLPVCLLR